jgi:hypothetical protein
MGVAENVGGIEEKSQQLGAHQKQIPPKNRQQVVNAHF